MIWAPKGTQEIWDRREFRGILAQWARQETVAPLGPKGISAQRDRLALKETAVNLVSEEAKENKGPRVNRASRAQLALKVRKVIEAAKVPKESKGLWAPLAPPAPQVKPELLAQRVRRGQQARCRR